MKIYQLLSGLSFLKKIFLQIPVYRISGYSHSLIGMLIYVVLSDRRPVSQAEMLLLILILTLLATAATLYILNRLLEPLIVSKNALEAYINTRTLPNLPVGFKDEAGILMQKVQTALMSMDEFVQAKQDMITLLSHDLRAPISVLWAWQTCSKSIQTAKKPRTTSITSTKKIRSSWTCSISSWIN
ncbi:hypothetical protein [Algoriphagus boritolerans]|uniref:hypothetical protein n=1 Tax=Algoriphagus boritolerans TaxID=308111 RepID=UPI002FCE3641